MNGIVEWLTGIFGNINPDIIVFVISILPVLELRGGMIAATLLGVPYVKALILCIVGTILPIPFILLFINKIFNWLKKFKTAGKAVNWIETKTLKKRKQLDKWGFWGLILFVGIPIPGTGAWTGSLLATLLRIPVKRSAVAIGIGVLLSAAIMSIITYLIPYLVSNA